MAGKCLVQLIVLQMQQLLCISNKGCAYETKVLYMQQISGFLNLKIGW